MKKVFISLVLMAFCSSAYTSTKSLSVPNEGLPVKATEVYIPVGKTGQLISLMDLSQISVKDLEKLTGKKMKFVEKVNFKIGQRHLRKNINDDGSFTSKKYENYFSSFGMFTDGISWSGLALGLFLSLIGVLIAYLIGGDKNKKGLADKNRRRRIRWAWIGAIISLIIWGVILI